MSFRLSTLLVIVTALAILYTQHTSGERMFLVGSLEAAALGLWAASRRRQFPLFALLGVASCLGLFEIVLRCSQSPGAFGARRIGDGLQHAFPMIVALFGSVLCGYAAYRGAKALMRRRREIIAASFRARMLEFGTGSAPAPRPSRLLLTQFRLSTLMILVAAVALLVTQRDSLPRFFGVAVVELTVAFGWMAAVGHPFPWNALVGGGLAFVLLTIPASFLLGLEDRAPFVVRVVNSLLAGATAAGIILLAIGLFYFAYSVVKDPFQRYTPSPGAFRRRRPANRSRTR